MHLLKKLTLSLTSVIILAVPCHSQNKSPEKLTRYVDPLIGSAAHGHVFVGANVPFGTVQLGPNNIVEGWDWCSGYNYQSNNITGFSHTHLSGTGIGDLGDVLIMPATGKLELQMGQKNADGQGWLSTFSHANETVRPGYYSVLLDKYNIKAELTATERVGFHKYTFPKKYKDPHFMLDLDSGIGWDATSMGHIKLLNSTTIVGYRYSTGWAKDQRLFFAIKLSQPLKSLAVYDSLTLTHGTELTCKHLKAAISFNDISNHVLMLKVAISPVSYENALLNLQTELPGWDFNATVKQADTKWEKELNKVRITASVNTKKVFYTALYHTMIAPSLFNDVNGDYRGTDKKVYKKAAFTNYTTFSLWDIYRAAQPLSNILHPEKVPDIVNTFLAIYKQQGKLPVWPLVGNETDCMVGYPAVPVIVDAYMKGFRGFDVNLAYEAVKQSAMQKTDGIQYIQQLKYIPADSVNEVVAKALEYAIGDNCIAQMAKSLHKDADYQYFSKRAGQYAQYFDPQTKFMRGKMADGSWRTPFSPLKSFHNKSDYTEGNAWQYTFLVPQDPYNLISLLGGDKAFIAKLDSLFTVPADLGEGSSPDISGLIGNYSQGDEPSHHTAYLYAYAGMPGKTADRVRTIDQEFYTAKHDGLCGNDDCGQMSAWYVFSSLGFYPVNPVSGHYVFGSPLIDGAVINLQGGKQFRISVINNGSVNKYIQKIVLNGVGYNKSYFTYQTLIKGGEMKIYMGSKPSATWGIAKADRP